MLRVLMHSSTILISNELAIRNGRGETMNVLVKLAASAAPEERKYVLFAGAGISKDAGLPTSWDLMLDTAKLLRAAEANQDEKDLQTWFLESNYAQMPYAELIGTLFPTAVEQQGFIRDKLRASAPGEAHRLIAELARSGVIRCVVTTNFDTLIEQALESAGLTVQVIANDEDLNNSEPLIQCKSFRVYKPHGTIGVGHIRNTPADLQQLSTEMEAELSRVMREHGLVVLGYSGADEGIRRAFRRSRNSHYPVFWVKPSEPPEGVRECFNAGTFNFIPCTGASQFLKDLILVYERLASLAPVAGMSGVAADAVDAVKCERKNAAARVRQFMESLTKELDALKPSLVKGDEDDLLTDALNRSLPLVTEYGRLAACIAEAANEEAAVAMFRGLGGIVQGYNLPPGFSGGFFRTQFDFHKFLGHELCVMLFQFLLVEERWSIVADLLERGLYVENIGGSRPDIVGLAHVSMHVELLDIRGKRRGLRELWERAQLLRERHSAGDLGQISPMNGFLDADFLLFLVAPESRSAFGTAIGWRPWSILVAGRVPRFLLESYRIGQAETLRKLLRAVDVNAMRARLQERLEELGRFVGGVGFYAFEGLDLDRIGTE